MQSFLAWELVTVERQTILDRAQRTSPRVESTCWVENEPTGAWERRRGGLAWVPLRRPLKSA